MASRPDLKGIPLSPLTGVLDLRSAPEAIPQGGLRMRQNLQTVGAGKLRRGSGWQKLLSETSYTNQDFHDQLLALTSGVRQPPTLVFEAESTRGVRSLFLATQCNIVQLDEYSGNWRVIGSGLGGTPVTDGTARRFKSAQVGDYLAFTNDFDAPHYHVMEQSPDDVTQSLLTPFDDFSLIGLSRAGGCFAWHDCLFFFDVEMDGERFAYRLLWSDYRAPISFDPAKQSSITGKKDLFTYERILGGRPGLGNTFLIYTSHGIWEMSVVGGEASFAFRRVYDSEKYEGVAVLKYPNTLVALSDAHVYLAEDGFYTFNQFSGRPKRIEWLHRSSPLLLDQIDRGVCEAHVAAFCNNELLVSVARLNAPNRLPDVTLRVNMDYDVADVVDHGFSAFCAYRSMNVPTVRDFLIENRICDLATLTASGYGFQNEGLPSPLPVSVAPFAPQEIYTATTQLVGDSDNLGPSKTVVEVSRTSNVATLKVVAHGLSTANRVDVTGISDTSFNAKNATITVPDVDHFTIASRGPNVSVTPAAAPFVRLIGTPQEAEAVVQTGGLVTVKMKAHGFSSGQIIRASARKGGNPAVTTAASALTVLDADTFQYPCVCFADATIFGKANILNLIPDSARYTYNPDGSPHYTNANGLIAGQIYQFTTGDNDLKLHLPGPNTDITNLGHFTYDGNGIDVVGTDDAEFLDLYSYTTSTSTPPANGNIAFNNANPALANAMYVARLDFFGNDQSQHLRDVTPNDTLRIYRSSDATFFHTVKVISIVKHNTFFEFVVTYQTGAGTLINGEAVKFSAIPTATKEKRVTARICAGLKVVVSTVGPVLTPTTVSRNDPDNPSIVTLALAAHGLVRDNVVWIGGMSDTSFNAFADKVVVIENTLHPTYSVTDANHFSYRHAGNLTPSTAVSSPAVRLLTDTNVLTEDWNQPGADSDSLCALVGSEILDDFCRQCTGPTIFVAASSADWCLKQLGGVFYRERCANPTGVGSTTSNGYASSVGSYVLDGYDSILRPAPLYTTAPGQPDVVCEEVKISYQAAAQTPPSVISLKVGISGEAKDPNITGCGIVWYQHSAQALKCNSGRTEDQHKTGNSQPNVYTHWNLLRSGRFLYPELTISGTGGDAIFTSVTADVKVEGQDNV